MTSIEAKKEWDSHLKECSQCQAYRRGDLDESTRGQQFMRSVVACPEGRKLWASVVNLQDKEYKNRT